MKRCGLIAAFCVIWAFPALAFWKAQYGNADPKITKWFSEQHNANGGWCCDKTDGHYFYGQYTPNADGSVDVTDDDGHSYHITKDLVLTGPNPTKRAVWWYYANTTGSKITFCFALGPLT